MVAIQKKNRNESSRRQKVRNLYIEPTYTTTPKSTTHQHTDTNKFSLSMLKMSSFLSSHPQIKRPTQIKNAQKPAVPSAIR